MSGCVLGADHDIESSPSVTYTRPKGDPQMTRRLWILLLGVLVSTLSLAAKQKEHDWQQGKLVSTDEARYFAGTIGSANTQGTVRDSGSYGTYSGTTTGSETAVYRVYQTYVIESDAYVYVARERLRWRWSKPANLTINGPIRFAVEKGHMFILDEDGKEHEARMTKKILKEKK